MGRSPRPTDSLHVDVAAIDSALQRADIAASLFAALERLDGPIRNIAAARDQLDARWAAAIDGCRDPRLQAFVRQPVGLRFLKRVAQQDPDEAGRLRERAEVVLRCLPAKGIPRAQLAAQSIGDSHALDPGQPVAALLLAVLRSATTPRVDAADGEETTADAIAAELREDRIRDIWASAGVLVNELARPALCLNLPTRSGEGRTDTPGEPAYLSLRMLLRSPPTWLVAGKDVFVCENPNFLAIVANQLGARSAPLLSVDGMPAAAQQTLLLELARAGAKLRYHGDFDWGGLRIGNYVMRRFGATPWRFSAADYEAAVAAAPRPGSALPGKDAEAVWDDRLGVVMRTHGLAIAEESLAASLIEDLAVRA